MDNSTLPIFMRKAVQHNGKSEEAGRAIFEEREYVEIHIAGDNKSVICRKVEDRDKARWPTQYEAFKRNQEAPIEGTPLKEWPILTVSQIAELEAMNVRTVEALAELSDTGINNYGMGGRELVKQATAFLDVSADAKAAQKYAKKAEKLTKEVKMLKDQIKELAARVPEVA